MVRRSFGNVRRLPSGRYQARYQVDPGGASVTAPTTFGTRGEADAWLARERTKVEAEASDSPRAPKAAAPTLTAYAADWLEHRKLRASTLRSYRSLIEVHLEPAPLAAMPVDKIKPADVRAWHRALAPGRPTARAHAYALLRTILSTAVRDELIDSNPCRIEGAGSTEPVTEVAVLTPAEVDALAAAIGEPWATAVYLGAYCQMRVGEVLALRRADVDLEARQVLVTRTLSWRDGAPHFGPPKTRAGLRAVSIPSPALRALTGHLEAIPKAPGALLFPGRTPTAPPTVQSFSDRVKRAAHRAGLPASFRFHHLRHTGLTLLAEAGATVAELQARAGHSTPVMALKYQHARAERDRDLADRLSALVEKGAGK